jgi:hypothetical protein
VAALKSASFCLPEDDNAPGTPAFVLPPTYERSEEIRMLETKFISGHSIISCTYLDVKITIVIKLKAVDAVI